jgi:myo-inositol-1-phosphate synthase
MATLDDLVFGGWDIFEDDCYAAARTAGVIEPALLEKVRPSAPSAPEVGRSSN